MKAFVNDKQNKDIKLFMQSLVAQTNKHKYVYKYLTFESGKKMLENSNIQFTRGDKLNDEEDCNICKCDMSKPIEILTKMNLPPNIIDNVIQKKKDEISHLGICSFGTDAENDTLWKRYASENKNIENGICIKLELDSLIKYLVKSNKIVSALLVRYVENVKDSIPWELFISDGMSRMVFLYLLFSIKNRKKWEREHELRLIMPEYLDEEYMRCVIDKRCFKGVYYGKEMTIEQRKDIESILSQYYPHINPESRANTYSTL